MRRATTKSRWHTPHAQFSGKWRHNPWINSINGSHARLETLDIAAQDRQQQAAMRVWEDDGGSISSHGDVLR